MMMMIMMMRRRRISTGLSLYFHFAALESKDSTTCYSSLCHRPQYKRNYVSSSKNKNIQRNLSIDNQVKQ